MSAPDITATIKGHTSGRQWGKLVILGKDGSRDGAVDFAIDKKEVYVGRCVGLWHARGATSSNAKCQPSSVTRRSFLAIEHCAS
jgi:hypothetical protein